MKSVQGRCEAHQEETAGVQCRDSSYHRPKGARTGAGLGRANYKWDQDSFLGDEHVLKLNGVTDYTNLLSTIIYNLLKITGLQVGKVCKLYLKRQSQDDL